MLRGLVCRTNAAGIDSRQIIDRFGDARSLDSCRPAIGYTMRIGTGEFDSAGDQSMELFVGILLMSHFLQGVVRCQECRSRARRPILVPTFE